MSAPRLRPKDLEHLPAMEFALPRTAFSDPAGLELELDLYHAVLAALEADGRPGIPLGPFVSILRALGYRKIRTNGRRFIAGLVLFNPPAAL